MRVDHQDHNLIDNIGKRVVWGGEKRGDGLWNAFVACMQCFDIDMCDEQLACSIHAILHTPHTSPYICIERMWVSYLLSERDLLITLLLTHTLAFPGTTRTVFARWIKSHSWGDALNVYWTAHTHQHALNPLCRLAIGYEQLVSSFLAFELICMQFKAVCT